jgi:hypothetical protein
MTIYYILEGHRAVVCADSMLWYDWMNHGDNRVALTIIGSTRVSTVFHGFDYSEGRRAEPLLFESATFVNGFSDDMIWYSTWAEAEAGHDRLVALLRARQARLERPQLALIAGRSKPGAAPTHP